MYNVLKKILKKGWLIPVIIILLILNIGVLLVNKIVPNEQIKKNMLVISKTTNNETYLKFQDTVLSLDEKTLNKINIRFIDPKKSDYKLFIDTYKVSTNFEIIITNNKGNVLERWSNAKDLDSLKKSINSLY